MGIEFEQLTRSWLAGVICGFIVSVPVGPLNLTVINQALHKGFKSAMLVGVGGVVGELLYVTLALAGHSSLQTHPAVARALRIAACIFIAGLAVRYLLFKPEKLQLSEAKAERMDERWHHPRAFLLGFVMTFSNLTLLVVWATMGAFLFAREWLEPTRSGRAACVVGVLIGGSLWFCLEAFFVSRAHRRISPRVLTLLVRACGVVMFLFAALLAVKLFQR